MKRYAGLLLTITLLQLSIVPGVAADGPRKSLQRPAGNQGLPNRTHFNINRISSGIRNDGNMDVDILQGGSGMFYPKGSGKTPVYCSGFVWGARRGIGGPVQIGGTGDYVENLQPGKILPGAIAEDPDLAKNRIYRVRKDIQPGNRTASVASEVQDFEGSATEIFDQYEKDWNEWPWQDGAPFDDRDGNGLYNPSIDVPGVKGADQTVWFVANDLNPSLANRMFECSPLGIEMQATVWGYYGQGAINNIEFRRFVIINKGQMVLDSMYVSEFVDPDVGDPGDDVVGCDSSRSLGFAYNWKAVDISYRPLPPPAVGFDFFQGPIVPAAPGESAIFQGKRVYGKRNLPMTAFYVFNNGVSILRDPGWTGGTYAGGLAFYNYMKGGIGWTGEPYVDPDGVVTKFPFAGDPVTGTGWLDGKWMPASDRRLGVCSGPFTMSPGDTQEVVLAVICAGATPGVSHLAAVTLLKRYDDEAQAQYDNFFERPVAPPMRKVSVTELDRKVVLAWDGDPAAANATENFESLGYAFQGYNVYMFPYPDATLNEARRLATYDVVDGVTQILGEISDPESDTTITKVVQFGSDSGIRRRFVLDHDPFNNEIPLVNGAKYYLAVTTYSYNPVSGISPTTLELPYELLTVVPHSLDPGIRYAAPLGREDGAIHVSGMGDATVEVAITDPSKLAGSSYTLGFYHEPHVFSPASVTGPVQFSGTLTLNEAGTEIRYNVTLSPLDSLSSRLTNVQLKNTAPDSIGPVVKDLNFAFKDLSLLGDKRVATVQGFWSASGTSQPLTPALVAELIAGRISMSVQTEIHPEGEVSAQFVSSGYPWYLDRGNSRVLSLQDNYTLDDAYFAVDGIQVKVGNVTFKPPITFANSGQIKKGDSQTDSLALWGDATLLKSPTGLGTNLFGGGQAVSDTDISQDLEFRFTGVPAAGARSSNDTAIVSGGSIATIYSTNRQAVARVRIPFELWEVERKRQINVAIIGNNMDNKAPWPRLAAPKWYRMSGKDFIRPVATPYNENASVSDVDIANPRATWVLFFHNGQVMPSHWDTGDRYVISYVHPIVPGVDLFSFTTPAAPSYSADVARQDIAQINVFPNPYYGVNPWELDKYLRFVTFNHLPQRAILRIFNLGGVMVRKIDKDTPSQFQQWDLKNESGLPVGSGLYIVHIEMPNLGVSKVLKLAIVQEQQVLDRY